MATTHKVKGQIATDEMFAFVLLYTYCGGLYTQTHTEELTHSPSLFQQRVDERACSCGWRMGDEEGEDGKMGGCWVRERGLERVWATDRQTTKDQRCPKVQKSLFNQAYTNVHTNTRAYANKHGPTESSVRSIFSHIACGSGCALKSFMVTVTQVHVGMCLGMVAIIN